MQRVERFAMHSDGEPLTLDITVGTIAWYRDRADAKWCFVVEEMSKALFKERCVSCHGSVKQKGGLRLDAGALIAKGGKHPVIVSGDSKRSALMERVLSHDDDERMPPEGKRLTSGQIELLRQWIDAGAAYPKNEAIPKIPSEHWSFQAVKRPPVPETTHEHPIDAFIFGKRDPAPRAPRGRTRRGWRL